MQKPFQYERLLNIRIPSISTPLLLIDLVGEDGLSSLFYFRATLISKTALDSTQLISKLVMIQIGQNADLSKRYYGLIYEIEEKDNSEEIYYYKLLIQPKLRWLADFKESRVYSVKKNLTIPEIVSQVLIEHKIEYRLALSKEYPTLPVCAQHEESPYNFISRLLERAGIYYFFKQEDDRALLILSDQAFPPYFNERPEILHHSRTQIAPYLSQWVSHVGMVPYQMQSQAYDFTDPKRLITNMETRHPNQQKESYFPAWFKGKFFNYQNEDLSHLDKRDKLRLQAQYLTANFITAKGQDSSWQAGSMFTMRTHPVPDQNNPYYIEAIAHCAHDYSHLPSSSLRRSEATAAIQASESAQSYSNTIRAHKLEHVFVPLGCTRGFNPHSEQGSMLDSHENLDPIPIKINKVDCLHKATVVGPENTPIYTDKYGRIKVQFDWDKESSHDENSFDWVRLKQGMAGSGFGMQMIPRVGQEVIVAFENGDINQAIVLGCLPNEANPLPFNPEKYPSQSGIQTRSLSAENKSSSKGHHLKFEDDAETASVSLHSHRDMQIKTAGDLKNTILGSSRTQIEEGNYVQMVGDTLKINAKTAVHFVCGQSRLSITDTDIIVEADEIAFDSEPMAMKQSMETAVSDIAVVPAPIVTLIETKSEKEKKEELDDEEFKLFVATVYGESVGQGLPAWNAIASVIMNRVNGPHEFHSTKNVTGVIKYPNAFQAYGEQSPQFKLAKQYLDAPGKHNKPPKIDEVKNAASNFYYNKAKPTTNALYYYSPYKQIEPAYITKGLKNAKLKAVKLTGLKDDNFLFYTYQ